MLNFPYISLVSRFAAYTNLSRRISGRTFLVVSESPSLEEIIFYFRQALEVCYRSNGRQLPEEFLLWIKRKITIDYSALPKDIQEGIMDILLRSPVGVKYIPKIVTNIPHN